MQDAAFSLSQEVNFSGDPGLREVFIEGNVCFLLKLNSQDIDSFDL